MDMKQIITATVAVILVCLVAVPIIDSSTETINTEQNNSAPLYTQMPTSGTIEISSLGDGNYKIGNAEYTPTKGAFIITDSVMARIAPDNTFTIYDPTNGKQTKFDDSNNLITFDNGVCRYNTSTGQSMEAAYSFLYVPDTNGTLGLYFMTGSLPLYLDKGQDLMVVSNPLNSVMFSAKVTETGTISYYVEPKVFNQTVNGTITDYNGNLNVAIDMSEAGDSPTGTWKLSKTAIVATPESGSALPLFFIAPITYHVISENDSIIISLLDLIPVLLIAALIVGIGYSIARRD